MLPKVVIHNSVSLDGSLVNFVPNLGLHYQIAASYMPQAHLIGSNTVIKGFEMFGAPPQEEQSDFTRPKRDQGLPIWVIIDSKGSLNGLLHGCRRFEYCGDVVILVSEKTPQDYLKHLEERSYPYHIVGRDKVDLRKALEILNQEHGVKTLLTDTGSILSNLLINQGLVDEISLLVSPVLIGKETENMFAQIEAKHFLKKIKCEPMGNDHVWLVYEVVKPAIPHVDSLNSPRPELG